MILLLASIPEERLANDLWLHSDVVLCLCEPISDEPRRLVVRKDAYAIFSPDPRYITIHELHKWTRRHNVSPLIAKGHSW